MQSACCGSVQAGQKLCKPCWARRTLCDLDATLCKVYKHRMRNEVVRRALDHAAGRHICDDCAETFLAILDQIRAERDANAAYVLPRPRDTTVPIPESMLADLRTEIRPAG